MYKMSRGDLIIVKAEITLKKTEDGGRIYGIKSGYRPNHVFELTNDLKNLKTYIGDIQFDNQETIEPGETKIVTVRFLRMSQIEKYIKIGQKWFINEAARTLGFGEILQIQNVQ
jgi:translation elongation factor EF-Tu-like GTPase